MNPDNTSSLSPIGCLTNQLTQKKLFQAIFNHSFQFARLLQPDAIVREINQTPLDFEGLTDEYMVTCPLWQAQWGSNCNEEYINKNSLSSKQDYFKAAIASSAMRKFVQYKVEVKKKDNQSTIVDFCFKRIVNEQGEVMS